MRGYAHRPLPRGDGGGEGELQLRRGVGRYLAGEDEDGFRSAHLLEEDAHGRVVALEGEAHALDQRHATEGEAVRLPHGGIGDGLDDGPGGPGLLEGVDDGAFHCPARALALGEVDGYLEAVRRDVVAQLSGPHRAFQPDGGAEEAGHDVVALGRGGGALVEEGLHEGGAVHVLGGDLAGLEALDDSRHVEGVGHLRCQIIIVRNVSCQLILVSDRVNCCHGN